MSGDVPVDQELERRATGYAASGTSNTRCMEKHEVRSFFTRCTGLLKNLNYASRDSQEYTAYQAQIDERVHTLGRAPVATAG
jgi:hypothetical protein